MRRFVFVAVAATVAVFARGARAGSCVQNPTARVNPATLSVVELSSVVLDGHASKGDAYSWTQTSGVPVQLTGADGDTATFSAPPAGEGGTALTFRLVVTGCDGSSPAVADTTVNVTNAVKNRPPLAVATVSPATVIEGGTVTLSATGSSDPDGDALAYAWKQTSGPTVVLGSETAATTSFTAPSVSTSGATLTFKLTVSDGSLHDIATASVSVKWVNDPPNAVARCTPVDVDESYPVTLDGSSSSDGDDGIASYEWTESTGGPSADLAGQEPTRSSFTFNAPTLKKGLVDTTMRFSLVVTDVGGLESSSTCTVTVHDVTPPVVTVPGPIEAEATSSAGAAVSFDVTADDALDGPVPVTCTPASGTTFPLDETTPVVCTATDAAGNVSDARGFTIAVRDTTPPTLVVPAGLTVEATGPAGAAVVFEATATDLVDGAVTPSCTAASGATFALGTATVSCTAADRHGNSATASFTITVQDTTPPALALPADVTAQPTEWDGAIVDYAVSAHDLVDLDDVTVSCAPAAKSVFDFGQTTVTCTAKDTRGNAGQGSFVVTVTPFKNLGFAPPVQPAETGAVNAVKAGSTVPFKWKLLGRDDVAITDTRATTGIRAQQVACDTSVEVDTPLEEVATGGTSLRYDFSAMQFIYNFQTPRTPGSCWILTVSFKDRTSEAARFKLK